MWILNKTNWEPSNNDHNNYNLESDGFAKDPHTDSDSKHRNIIELLTISSDFILTFTDIFIMQDLSWVLVSFNFAIQVLAVRCTSQTSPQAGPTVMALRPVYRLDQG